MMKDVSFADWCDLYRQDTMLCVEREREHVGRGVDAYCNYMDRATRVRVCEDVTDGCCVRTVWPR